ncbi:amino acid transporter [Plasmodium gonderi]|uniref:Amino acid transporter n=1 Tax=Plasmodium gonderi TaxID=77519 RepID=A0A1Y1JN70_PLAGO|nr:amino acid transporter [Plasmodium gonderi]GAW83690.1 amino acid transporter [Plasmodium gonderi]
MNIKWLSNISLFNYKEKKGKHNFVRSRKRFRTITWKYTKTIGPFASFIYIFNQSIGSSLFDIPSLIDEVGWIPVILGNMFICSVAVFCSLMILRAMTMIPKNKNFEQRIEYSAVIKYFMSNEKYKIVSFLYHLGNLCNNICGILVISKIIDIFIIKLFGHTILFQVYPEIKISKCSLSLLNSMFNGYYYSSTGHYETIVIYGFTLGYIINAIICIHLSSKGLEETINYQYVVFMIFMTSFLYLSVSSTIYLLSQNYIDEHKAINNLDAYNNLILNRVHLETDLIKNYGKHKELNNIQKNLQLCKNPFFDKCPGMNNFEKNNSPESSPNAEISRFKNIVHNFQRELKRDHLQRNNKIFSCSCFYLNPLYKKNVYVFHNNIFYFMLSSCVNRLNIKNTKIRQHFYSVYKFYEEKNIIDGRISSQNMIKWWNHKIEMLKKKENNDYIENKFHSTYNRNGGKEEGINMNSHQENLNYEKKEKTNKMFFKNLYYMISRIEGIKTYCMGKTFANFIDSYGFVSNIPSWGNEITDDVNVSKSMWVTAIFSSIFYFIFGLIFCLNNSFQNINTSVLYIFNFVAVAPKVITGSISMRYDLMNLDICSDSAAFFFGCIAPFLSAWIFSNGIIFSDAFNYISLICGLFCNFLSPAFAYISACESNKSFYKNPLRKYTIVNRKKTVFSCSSDIRKALGNIIDTFDDNDNLCETEDGDNEKENYQYNCHSNQSENEGIVGYRRSMSLNRYINPKESQISSVSGSSYFKLINGEYTPKSYSKDSTCYGSLSYKSSNDFKLLSNNDSYARACAETIEMEQLCINEDIKKEDNTDNNACTEKKNNQKKKKKKKKGVMFSDEVKEYSSEKISISKSICPCDENGLRNITRVSNLSTKECQTNDKNIDVEPKKVSFSMEQNRIKNLDDMCKVENISHELLEDNKNTQKEKKGKKILMFADQVEMCNDVNTILETKKQQKKKGVTFKDEPKEPFIENAKYEKKEKKVVMFMHTAQVSSEEIDIKENRQVNKTLNDQMISKKKEEPNGNLNPISDAENLKEKEGTKEYKTSLFKYENENQTKSKEILKEESTLSNIKENEEETNKNSKNKCTDKQNHIVDNHFLQETINQKWSSEKFSHYEIKKKNNNKFIMNDEENGKNCIVSNGQIVEIENCSEIAEAAQRSENEGIPDEDRIELKEKKRKILKSRCVHFEEDRPNDTFPTLLKNSDTQIENITQYERNFSDLKNNYDVKKEMKKIELKENKFIKKNDSFEHKEQIFKRQRGKLKSYCKHTITNVLENFDKYDNSIQNVQPLEQKENNRDKTLNNTLKTYEKWNEINPNCNAPDGSYTNDKLFVQDTMIEEIGDIRNKENTFSSFEKDDFAIISNEQIDKTRDRNKTTVFSEQIHQIKENETGTSDPIRMEGKSYSINLKKEISEDSEILINLKDVRDENYLDKNNSQIGQSLHIYQKEDKLGENSRCFHSDDVLTCKNHNNCGTIINNCQMNLLINNASYKDERGSLLSHSKSDELTGKTSNIMHIFSPQEENIQHEQQFPSSLKDHKKNLFSFLNNPNKYKSASYEIISLPDNTTMQHRKLKSLSTQGSINEVEETCNKKELNKNNILFIRQRKKLKSSFHANGDMITGNHKEAIHKEQINEFRKQISEESYITNYYNDEQCTGMSQTQECQMEKEKTNQVNMNKDKIVQDNQKLEISTGTIMKSCETETITPTPDVVLKDSIESKSIEFPRRKTCYKFVDISKLISDLDECEFESEENKNIDSVEHRIEDNNEGKNDEEKGYYFMKSTIDINLSTNKSVSFHEEENEIMRKKATSAEIEKPDVVKKLEKMYSALSNKLHSENSEIFTNDDTDYTDCVDVRCFKIIDNISPVKHYYNAFHRSRILDSKKYDHIYSNDIMIDNKTNMDHLCSIFLFGNPLERNEEYENNKKNLDSLDEPKDITKDTQKEIDNSQDKYDSTSKHKDKKKNILQDRYDSTTNHEDERKDISSNSLFYEEKDNLIIRSFSGNLGRHGKIQKRTIFEKSELRATTGLSRRKSNLSFNPNEEVINSEELNDIIRSNDIVGDVQKRSSNKIEVIKIRIHVYPSLLQKYHVETTYLLLGCLTVFSFVAIISDLLFV